MLQDTGSIVSLQTKSLHFQKSFLILHAYYLPEDGGRGAPSSRGGPEGLLTSTHHTMNMIHTATESWELVKQVKQQVGGPRPRGQAMGLLKVSWYQIWLSA